MKRRFIVVIVMMAAAAGCVLAGWLHSIEATTEGTGEYAYTLTRAVNVNAIWLEWPVPDANDVLLGLVRDDGVTNTLDRQYSDSMTNLLFMPPGGNLYGMKDWTVVVKASSTNNFHSTINLGSGQ